MGVTNNSKIVSKAIAAVKKLWSKGLFHMFGAKIINQVIIFCSGMILVRILTKEDYGIYSYVQNTIAFFLLLDGFGATNGLLQYGSLNYNTDKMYSFFKLSIIHGVFANAIIALFIIIYALLLVSDAYLRELFIIASLLPLFNIIFSIFQIFNIINRDNKFYSYYTTANTVLMMSALLGGAILWNIKGIFLLNYIALLITILIGFIHVDRYIKNKHFQIVNLKKQEIVEYGKFSLVAMSSNAVSHIVLILDVFLIGLIVNDMKILASFKTATLIPFGLLFLPSTIMIFVYPYFSQNSKKFEWIRTSYSKLVKCSIIFYFIITSILIGTSNWLIPLIFGDQYIDSILPFNILCIGFFFAASFRSPAGNTLAALGKVKINLYVAIITGILNILLDIVLIKIYGSIGAAVSSALVLFVSALMGNICLFNVLNRKESMSNEKVR